MNWTTFKIVIGAICTSTATTMQLMFIPTFQDGDPNKSLQIFAGIFAAIAVSIVIFALAASSYSDGLKTVLTLVLITGLMGELYLTNSLDKLGAIGGEYALMMFNLLLRVWLLIDLNGQSCPVTPDIINALSRPSVDLNNVYNKVAGQVANVCRPLLSDQRWDDLKSNMKVAVGATPSREPAYGGKRR